MKLFFKSVSVFLCAVLLLSTCMISTFAVNNNPGKGIFIFGSERMTSYAMSPHNLDVAFSEGEKTMKLTVNSNAADPDPYFSVDMSDTGNLKAEDCNYLLIVYRAPASNSNKAVRAEVFPSAGSVMGPTGGCSVQFDIQTGSSYKGEIIDLSALSWWNGDVHGIRIDPFCAAAEGDTMYIDTVALCKNTREAEAFMNERLENTYTPTDIYLGTDYSCTAYDVTKYTAPLWKGGIVYNEAIYPIMDSDGNAVYTLMYTPDRVISLYSSNFNSYYAEGVDYKVEGNKLTVLKTGSIPLVSYSYIHRKQNDGGYRRTAAGDGMFEHWGQSKEFFDGYLNITYTHSDKWAGYVPTSKAEKLPRTANKISNKDSINIVYFGDSICGGANASSYRNVYPYAEWWNQQISSKLQKDYGCKVNATYASVGGSTASDMVSSVYNSVIRHSPDLVFIEYGANDAMNASQSDGYSASRLKSEFKSGVGEMIRTIRNSLPNCEIVLVAPFYCNIYCHYQSYFESCRDALAELESEYSGVAMADVTSMHSYLLTFKDYLDMSGDNMCHPNDFMSRVFSQVCLETILPDGTVAYEPEGELPNPGDIQIRPSGKYSYAAPGGHGWSWSQSDAYGQIAGYGKNGQDIIITFDLCLLKSTEPSVAKLWTRDEGHIFIAEDHVSIGDKYFSYDWGKTDLTNWHTVSISIYHGAATVIIDGEAVASVSTGVRAYTEYQLLFSNSGSMCIDNVSMKTSKNISYFSCDFENAEEAQKLMGGGLGQYASLAANTVSYDLNGGSGKFMNQIKIDDVPMPVNAESPEREGFTFQGWSKTKDGSVELRPGDLYSSNESITLYAVWTANATSPEIESITPRSAEITGIGSVTYTMIANGGELAYQWQCTSDNADKVTLSGVNSQGLIVSVTVPMKESFEAKFICTVTNEYGLSVTSDEVTFIYNGTNTDGLIGDLTGDGRVNAKDSNLMKRIIKGAYEPNEREFKAADLVADGSINTKDSYILKRIISGIG